MKRNIMFLLCGAALTASAQTDVTADYLTHYDFDSGFHHKAGATTEVKQEIKTITGWTAGFTVDYTITGIYEYGFAGTFNGGEVPSKGYQNSEGGALALSTGWGVAMTYSQNVTLPAGTYTINVPTYNGKSASFICRCLYIFRPSSVPRHSVCPLQLEAYTQIINDLYLQILHSASESRFCVGK